MKIAQARAYTWQPAILQCRAMTKQRILDEIRRTAQENGGKPLGRSRFVAATGITEGEWLGKYWARWGDVIREAGLTPNALVSKIDDNTVLAKLAGLTRELGRFPTQPEMRLRKRQDASFPNDGTFERFGNRDAMVFRLQRFCEQNVEWEDVSAICRSSVIAEPPADVSADEGTKLEDGFVYLALMTIGREKRYKIGKANVVEQRTRQIGPTLPEDLSLVHSIRTDDPYGIEQYWHRRFSKKRRNGEWFVLSTQEVRAFKRRKFM